MKKIFILLQVLLFLLVQTVAVSAFTWDTYEGVTQWKVDVTEDETDCGGSVETESYAVAIQHNLEIADVGNWGHGKTRATFSSNKLSFTARSIPDGVGTSDLSSFDLAFTANCLGFSGKYNWYYEDSFMDCSGTTQLEGTRQDDDKCPGEEEQPAEEPGFVVIDMVVDARAELDNTQKESIYNEILANDPDNFWANWDMAELKKKQGNYEEFSEYFNAAVSNENIFEETREELKEVELERLHLSDFPTATTSPLLRIEQDELENWNGGLIHNVYYPKEEAEDTKKWSWKFWTIQVPDSYEIINDIVGLPTEEDAED